MAAGQDLDPLHAAMIGTLFEGAGKGISKANEVVPLAPVAFSSGIAAGGHALGVPDLLTAPVALGAGYLASKGFSPTKYAKSEVFKNLPEKSLPEVLEAAQRLDIDVMPSEAAKTAYHGKKAGRYGATGESAIKYEKFLDERDTIVKNKIENFFEKISPESNKSIISEGYKATDNVLMPTNKIANIAVEDPTVIAAMKDMHSDPAYQRKLRGISPDTVGYWDIVREFLVDKEQSTKTNMGKNTSASDQYHQAANDVRKIIDDVSPERTEVRRLKELQHTRNRLEEIFYPKGKTLGAKDLGDYLLDDRKFNKLMTNLREVPKKGEEPIPREVLSELQQMATDMRTVFPQLFHNKKHQTAEFGERASTAKKRESSEVLKDIFKETIGAKYENAIVDLITNPNWPQIFAEYQAKNKPNLAAEMMKSLGYQLPVSAYAGKNEGGKK